MAFLDQKSSFKYETLGLLDIKLFEVKFIFEEIGFIPIVMFTKNNAVDNRMQITRTAKAIFMNHRIIH